MDKEAWMGDVWSKAAGGCWNQGWRQINLRGAPTPTEIFKKEKISFVVKEGFFLIGVKEAGNQEEGLDPTEMYQHCTIRLKPMFKNISTAYTSHTCPHRA